MDKMMEQVMLILNEYLIYIVLGLGVLVVILFIVILMTNAKLKKLKCRYEKFMAKDEIDLEELLVQYTKKINTLLQNEKEIKDSIKALERSFQDCVQKVGVIRYNAIANTGADLSFAIALLDSHNNGFVINGIYSRDGSYTYAKPLVDGKSKYNLSEEEEQAIQQAIKGGTQ